jgi:uncharacterized metal-binding protein (TIGR02443 family)
MSNFRRVEQVTYPVCPNCKGKDYIEVWKKEKYRTRTNMWCMDCGYETRPVAPTILQEVRKNNRP